MTKIMPAYLAMFAMNFDAALHRSSLQMQRIILKFPAPVICSSQPVRSYLESFAAQPLLTTKNEQL